MSDTPNQAGINQMLAMAREAQTHAYAPYSNFYVGACIRTTTGELFSGCNVENVSYPITQCSEASACGAMITAGFRHIAEILVIGSGTDICPPCGACRQMLYEFSQTDTKLHLCNQNGLQHTIPLIELLPKAFNSKHLEEII